MSELIVTPIQSTRQDLIKEVLKTGKADKYTDISTLKKMIKSTQEQYVLSAEGKEFAVVFINLLSTPKGNDYLFDLYPVNGGLKNMGKYNKSLFAYLDKVLERDYFTIVPVLRRELMLLALRSGFEKFNILETDRTIFYIMRWKK